MYFSLFFLLNWWLIGIFTFVTYALKLILFNNLKSHIAVTKKRELRETKFFNQIKKKLTKL